MKECNLDLRSIGVHSSALLIAPTVTIKATLPLKSTPTSYAHLKKTHLTKQTYNSDYEGLILVIKTCFKPKSTCVFEQILATAYCRNYLRAMQSHCVVPWLWRGLASLAR